MCSLFSYVLIEIENKKLMRLKRLRSERTGRLTHLSALLRQKPVIFFLQGNTNDFFLHETQHLAKMGDEKLKIKRIKYMKKIYKVNRSNTKFTIKN